MAGVELRETVLGEMGFPTMEQLLYRADDRHRMIAEAAYQLAERRCFARGEESGDARDDWASDDIRVLNAITHAGKGSMRVASPKRSN